ncbi:protein Shroom1 [Falco cherrug]|uniref:protein Shroom1 n=1 Tax=Falco cherrug TaxID=345164 RepID=UPI002478B071|nr:protein Shroom1 [Falco cherrug]
MCGRCVSSSGSVASASVLVSWDPSLSIWEYSSATLFVSFWDSLKIISAVWRSGKRRVHLSCLPAAAALLQIAEITESSILQIAEITAPSSELEQKRHLQQLGYAQPSKIFCDPEKDGYENHEYRDSDITGRARCQDAKELTPETPIPVPRSGSKEDAQVEEECRTKSLSGHALVKYPDQEPASSPERVACCHGAVAQPHQGDKNTAKGLTAKETSVHNSQSDFLPEGETNLPQRRLQSPEDQRYEELAMEIIAKDNSLVDVLIPHPLRKTALDLIEGLFPVDVSMLDKWHRKKGDIQHVQENDRKSSRDATEEHPESEQGAKQRSEDPASKGNKVLNRCRGSMDNLDDITSKKLELISSLRSKLQTLWEERELVLSEARECTERGEELQATVRDVCKPNEFERYMMFIGDLEKVVSLLLCLSSRLARVQNAMRRIDGNTDAEEKQSLNERHKLLSRQREDAKDLKENLDRRERVVSGILAKYLTEQQLQDYRRFVQVKTSLLIEQKDLEEQIKFFKEQLENLEKSIPL